MLRFRFHAILFAPDSEEIECETRETENVTHAPQDILETQLGPPLVQILAQGGQLLTQGFRLHRQVVAGQSVRVLVLPD